MHRLHTDRLDITMGHVFIGVNKVEALTGHTLGVPAKPKLVEPATSHSQLGHPNMLEHRRRLVKILRYHGDVAFAQHGCRQRNSQAFGAAANFGKITGQYGEFGFHEQFTLIGQRGRLCD